MTRTPANTSDTSNFDSVLHLFPTVEAVVEQNINKLHSCGQPVVTIKAVHTGANASKVSADDAGGLQPVICLTKGARVMLSSNLSVDMALLMVPWELYKPSPLRKFCEQITCYLQVACKHRLHYKCK